MNPRRVLHLIPIIVALAVLVFAGSLPALAQDGDSETFSNGHTVSGAFYQFYYSVKDPHRVFGLPITVVFTDPQPPFKQIQYFERVRMELDPNLPKGSQVVTLANLGEFAYDPKQAGREQTLSPNDPQCRVFPNAKLVCYGFRDFYEQYGENFFGQPVSNVLTIEDGRHVQYFEKVRMEWRGEMPYGQRVVVTSLGPLDYNKRIGNPVYLAPNGGGLDIPSATRIIPTMRAFTGRSLLAKGDQQKVFVIIYDQFGRPIKNAPVTFTVYMPDENLENMLDEADAAKDGSPVAAIPTNDAGIAVFEYTVKQGQPNNTIRVRVDAVVNGQDLTARTWFRLWW